MVVSLRSESESGLKPMPAMPGPQARRFDASTLRQTRGEYQCCDAVCARTADGPRSGQETADERADGDYKAPNPIGHSPSDHYVGRCAADREPSCRRSRATSNTDKNGTADEEIKGKSMRPLEGVEGHRTDTVSVGVPLC